MSTRRTAVALSLLLATAAAAAGESPNLGKPISEAEIAQWSIHSFPDGTNLPPGSGTAVQGAPIYAQKCALCHGAEAKGGAAPGATALVGGPPLTSGIDAPKTIGNFFGYATTVFDSIRRGMPFNMPLTLTNDEVYALTAYLLALNKIIGENEVMDAKTLPAVKMPNRDNFIIRFPDRI